MHSISFRTAVLIAILLSFSPLQACYAQSKSTDTLSANAPPSQNFDLSYWNLSIPTDSDGDGNADTISEAKLNQGFQNSEYFYTGSDRTELREMLRRGDTSIATKDKSGIPNKNNWVLSSAPKKTQKLAGAVDGVLEATLAVNHVTTTGRDREMGRVIIGQIHAKKDEPIRLYYHKRPENKRGWVYAAHEPAGKKDQYFDLIGRRGDQDPKDGIALDEKFSYKIVAKGNKLHVTISDSNGKRRAKQTINMSRSNYDVKDDFMYFKAGAYNQNKSGRDDDYAQAGCLRYVSGTSCHRVCS